MGKAAFVLRPTVGLDTVPGSLAAIDFDIGSRYKSNAGPGVIILTSKRKAVQSFIGYYLLIIIFYHRLCKCAKSSSSSFVVGSLFSDN